MLGQVADLDVVAGRQPAARRTARPPVSALDERRLAGAVRADERDVLAALEPHRGVVQQHLGRRGADLQVRAARARTRRAPERSALPKLSDISRVSRGSRSIRSILFSALTRDCAWRALVAFARKRSMKRSIRSISACCFSIALPSAISRAAASRAPLVPRAGEEPRAARLELEHRGADRLEEPAVVGDHDDRGVERLELGLQPLERVDVEVVRRLVEQEQVGLGGERAGQRGARELAAGEARELAVEGVVGEAEVVEHRRRAVAPRVAAAVLELALQPRVAVVDVGRPRRHLVLHATAARPPWR